MKKLLLIFILFLSINGNLVAQLHTCENNPDPSFKERYIDKADLIVEGVITSKTFFQYKTKPKQNIPFEYYASDSNGIWFVKYEISVHKIFKGEYLTKVSIICPSITFPDFLPKKRNKHGFFDIEPFHHHRGLEYGDYPLQLIGIFPLAKTFNSNIRLDSHSYYFVPFVGCIGSTYANIDITNIRLADGDGNLNFENAEKLYEYLEKQIGKEKITIIDKKFIAFKTYSEVEEFKWKYFQDSSRSNSYINKIEKGIINQLNFDSFIVKPKPPPSEQEIKALERKRDSMNRIGDEFEKRMRELQKFIEERNKKTQLNKKASQ